MMDHCGRIGWAVVASLLLLANGCGRSPEQQLVGSWRGKFEANERAIQERVRQAGENPFNQQIARTLMATLRSASMDMHFHSDGTVMMSAKMGPAAEAITSQWEVVDRRGDRVTLKLSGNQRSTKQVVLTFEGPDRFRTNPPGADNADLGTMRFVRGS